MRQKNTKIDRPHRLAPLALVAALALGAALPAGAQAPGAPAAAPPALTAATAPTGLALLREVAQEAVLNNPEVRTRLHTARAAEGERDAARGGYLPRVDLSSAVGPQHRNNIGSYQGAAHSLTLNQLLFDRFATRNEVDRLDHATRVRLFEFFDTSEAIALEAARAYIDVARYRELARLAENNFVNHRAVFGQIEQRVRARVARGVDLEQVTGRLALAEANLLTETSNLHDTTARFQRIVGRMPARDLPLPAAIPEELPANAAGALARAEQGNPALLAAIENVRASQAALATRNSAYWPRFDLRLRRDQGRNLSGVPGSTNASAAEVVLNWNLFNGFADTARERQFAEQLNVAKDLRDKTCRDIRQTLLIAYNDVVKLQEQLRYLTAHEAASTRALTAYRQQFDIGQRTLLDLLDTENELFQASRAVVNARHDLVLASLRTHAAMGNLLRTLGLTRLDAGVQTDLSQVVAGGERPEQCPTEPVELYVVQKDALVARAIERMAASRSVVPLPEAAAAAPAAPQVAAAPAPDAGVRSALEQWRAAWARRDVAGYLQSYASGFDPGTLTRQAWEQRRRAVIGKAGDVQLSFADVAVRMEGPDRATTTFVQDYAASQYRDRVAKTLQWQRIDGRWLIVRETAAPVAR